MTEVHNAHPDALRRGKKATDGEQQQLIKGQDLSPSGAADHKNPDPDPGDLHTARGHDAALADGHSAKVQQGDGKQHSPFEGFKGSASTGDAPGSTTGQRPTGSRTLPYLSPSGSKRMEEPQPLLSPGSLLLRSLELKPMEVLEDALEEFPQEVTHLVKMTADAAKAGKHTVLRPHVLKDLLCTVVKDSPRCHELEYSELVQLLREQLQEVVVGPTGPEMCLSFRVSLKSWEYVLVRDGPKPSIECLSVNHYLMYKERVAGEKPEDNPFAHLEFDLGPFFSELPMMSNNRSIGQGVTFLNRQLSSYFFCPPGVSAESCSAPGREMLLTWLQQRKMCARTASGQAQELALINPDKIKTPSDLAHALLRADRILEPVDDEQPASVVAPRLSKLGLSSGWGNNVGLIRTQVQRAAEIMQAPSAEVLEDFLSHVPFLQSVVILSPHGYFAQSGVLGLPDTGGQVVYILDQVRALVREMRRRFKEAGLPPELCRVLVVTRLIPDAPSTTTCSQRYEEVEGCEGGGAILRVPFRNAKGEVLRDWISRFEVAPYLERFALDVEHEILGELGAPPHLVVGNYTDGNMVASLLCQRLGVPQCNIAHALEMTKYTDANLKWRDLDPEYHFSCQFVADLLAMNMADFIITSTYQEIAGKEGVHSLGQYETFRSFTMPGLIRVIQGINVFDPRFNIVSPGADEEVYYPHTEKDKRLTDLHGEIDDILYGQKESKDSAVGVIDPSRRELPILFAMARLDKVKNLTGLAEMYASSPELQELCNLVIVGGVLDPEHTTDREEKAECDKMYSILKLPKPAATGGSRAAAEGAKKEDKGEGGADEGDEKKDTGGEGDKKKGDDGGAEGAKKKKDDDNASGEQQEAGSVKGKAHVPADKKHASSGQSKSAQPAAGNDQNKDKTGGGKGQEGGAAAGADGGKAADANSASSVTTASSTDSKASSNCELKRTCTPNHGDIKCGPGAAACAAVEAGKGEGSLRGRVRWVVAQRNKIRNGELYRVIADTRGAFVQPALFEAFGLTVIEAMTCGLPTFATCHGGPSEVIKHGKSGFQIDPYHPAEAAQVMVDFFTRAKNEKDYWDSISNQGLERIMSRYTWNIYASRLIDLAQVYSFWRHASDLSRREAKRYLSAIYTLLWRQLAAKVPTDHHK